MIRHYIKSYFSVDPLSGPSRSGQGSSLAAVPLWAREGLFAAPRSMTRHSTEGGDPFLDLDQFFDFF